MEGSASPAAYRLDQLGWLQFERLASLFLEFEAGITGLAWRDVGEHGRLAWAEGPVALPGFEVRLPGPVAVLAVWIRGDPARPHQRYELVTRVLGVTRRGGVGPNDCLVVLTNLDGPPARRSLAVEAPDLTGRMAVVGAGELTRSLDRHPGMRAAMPAVLGLRDLGTLIPAAVRDRSSVDVERAQALARVFVVTRAYEQARAVLARHRFAVLTGPPEMGKTAIARMIALAQLTDGWEAHDCLDPDQVWRAFAADRPQVFVADDAFGSTEYRADAAERWARELGRLLGVLDPTHWLLWTSRPAPLRAGLRRVQRERGSERFPSPGEVLVDASDLDLAEKTLILFRHVKDRGAASTARDLVRSVGPTIVEHPHFTPERIRRFVAGRLDELVEATRGQAGPLDVRLDRRRRALLDAVERELATPTAQMATSFRALAPEHRALLVALLDTPAGLTDERELAATVRRHHPGGLSRPPHELIDRLADHFLRLTPLGIDWVHPSWRDLVIEELRAEPAARRRFLRLCGPYGALLVLSAEGGAAGERTLPLLLDDGDWDAFTGRVGQLLRELEDADLARLLAACAALLGADLDPARRREAEGLTAYVLGAVRRSWDGARRALAPWLLDAWYAAAAGLPEPPDRPRLAATWAELRPGPTLGGTPKALRRAEEWLAMIEVLAAADPRALGELGFPAAEEAALERLGRGARSLLEDPDPETRRLAEQILGRLREIAPNYAGPPLTEPQAGLAPPDGRRWWVPEDIEAPPTTDPVASRPGGLTRAQLDRVLSDL